MVIRKEEGFTLMEVVTAIFIFLVGIVGVISLFATAAVLHKGARDKTMAALAIQQVLTEIDLKLKSGEFRDEKGDLKPVVDGRVYGYERYRYQVKFKEEDVQKSFEEARDQVYMAVRAQKEMEIQRQVLDELKLRYDVVIHRSKLGGL